MKLKISIVVAVVLIAVAVFLTIHFREDAHSDFSEGGATSQHVDTRGDSVRETSDASREHRRSTHSAPLSKLKGADRVDYVLAEKSLTNQDACRILLGVVADDSETLDVRNDALEHTLNLIEDDDFDSILSVMDQSKKAFPEPLEETILDATLNRNEKIQLTTALKIMEGGRSNVADEARELLEFHLDVSHSEDMQKWRKAVDVYLRNQEESP